MNTPYQAGDRVVFMPSAFVQGAESKDLPLCLSGRVVYVNEAHRYYTAEAACNGCVIRESYKF